MNPVGHELVWSKSQLLTVVLDEFLKLGNIVAKVQDHIQEEDTPPPTRSSVVLQTLKPIFRPDDLTVCDIL